MEDVPQKEGTTGNKWRNSSFGKAELVCWLTHIHWKCMRKKDEYYLYLCIYIIYQDAVSHLESSVSNGAATSA
jgi:hypothetical protein